MSQSKYITTKKYQEANPEKYAKYREDYKAKKGDELKQYHIDYNREHAEVRKEMSRIQREAKAVGMSYSEYKKINYPDFTTSLNTDKMKKLKINRALYANNTDINTNA